MWLLIKLFYNPLQALAELSDRAPYFVGAALAFITGFLYYNMPSGELWAPSIGIKNNGRGPASAMVLIYMFRLVMNIFAPVLFLGAIFVPAALLSASLLNRRYSFRALLNQEYAPLVSAIFYSWAAAHLLSLGGIEFGDRGVDVFDVEPHLQQRFDRLRRCRTAGEIRRAAPQGSRRQCRSVNRMRAGVRRERRRRREISHHARLGSSASCHVATGLRRKLIREADDFPATLDENLGGEQPLELVPGLAIDSGHQAFAHSHARVVQLDDRPVLARRSRAERPLSGQERRAFSASAAAPFSSYSSTACSAAARAPAASPAAPNTVASARQASPWSTKRVGALGDGDRLLGDPPSLVVITAARQQLRPNRPPGDRRLQRVAGEPLALRAQFVGLGVPVERQACAAPAARRSRRCRHRGPCGESRCKPAADAARRPRDRRRPARRCLRTGRPRAAHAACRVR